MTAVFKITDGASDTVDLVGSVFSTRDLPRGVVRGLSQREVAMDIVLELEKQADHDDAADQLRALRKLLARAVRYHRSNGQQGTPIYIEQKADSETNSRYSTILDVQEMPQPDVLDYVFKTHKSIIDYPIVVIREANWRSGAPGVLGTAVTLSETNGPSNPNFVFIANHRDNSDVDAMRVFDASGSSYTTPAAGSALFPATPGTGDAFMWCGTASVPFTSLFPIATPGTFSWTMVHEYYAGTVWAASTYGDDYTLYPKPTTDESDAFKQAGDNAVSFFGKSDHGTLSVDGVNGYWQRMRISAISSTTTLPTLGTTDPYAQATPEVRMPAALFTNGDVFPLFNTRLHAPAGGDENEGPDSVSRILVGVRTQNLTNFVSHLNAGGQDNPAAWAVTQGTDATATADPTCPGGNKSRVDFSSESAMAKRVTFTGTNMIDDYDDEYLIIPRVEQIGGDAGDLSVKVVVRLGSADSSAPHKETKAYETQGADQGWEPIDCRQMRIPFGRTYDADSMGGDLIIEIWAERTTGTAVLDIIDLILLPIREGVVEYRSIVQSDLLGAEALRGGNVLEDDMGVLAPRFVKYDTIGGNLVPGETWGRANLLFDPDKMEQDQAVRLYFLIESYPINGTWGTPPLISAAGQMLGFEAHKHDRHSVLRGDA